jgi:hypothetical protein
MQVRNDGSAGRLHESPFPLSALQNYSDVEAVQKEHFAFIRGRSPKQ